jgi:hypothetical protein
MQVFGIEGRVTGGVSGCDIEREREREKEREREREKEKEKERKRAKGTVEVRETRF